MCVRIFIFFIVELRGVRLIRGLPRGISSLVECTLVRTDVAAVRGYSVVSMVRLGLISCTYPPWSAYCFVVWCGDSEALSSDLWKMLSTECAAPWPAAELCPTKLSPRGIKSVAAHAKNDFEVVTLKIQIIFSRQDSSKAICFEFCSSTKVLEVLEIIVVVEEVIHES